MAAVVFTKMGSWIGDGKQELHVGVAKPDFVLQRSSRSPRVTRVLQKHLEPEGADKLQGCRCHQESVPSPGNRCLSWVPTFKAEAASSQFRTKCERYPQVVCSWPLACASAALLLSPLV